MLNILFIGDIVGKIGRKTIAKILPSLRKELKINFVIANAENIAHGSGITPETIQEILNSGVDYCTSGDHVFRKRKQAEKCFEDNLPVIRPANFPPSVSGKGYAVINYKKHKILLINLIGRVFMRMHYDCPFRKLDEILANKNLAKDKFSAIIIDIHAETASEKIALAYYAQGRVSAVFGTHTHVMTADHKIINKEMAYITDVGMVGYANGSLGVDKEGIIKTFLEQINYAHQIPEKGEVVFNACLVKIDPRNAKANLIQPIIKFDKIN